MEECWLHGLIELCTVLCFGGTAAPSFEAFSKRYWISAGWTGIDLSSDMSLLKIKCLVLLLFSSSLPQNNSNITEKCISAYSSHVNKPTLAPILQKESNTANEYLASPVLKTWLALTSLYLRRPSRSYVSEGVSRRTPPPATSNQHSLLVSQQEVRTSKSSSPLLRAVSYFR